MTFDLYNYQTPQWPDCTTSKICSGDIGLSENYSAENSPWGEGGGLLPAQSLFGKNGGTGQTDGVQHLMRPAREAA